LTGYTNPGGVRDGLTVYFLFKEYVKEVRDEQAVVCNTTFYIFNILELDDDDDFDGGDSVQFLFMYVQTLTAQRQITKLARLHRKKQQKNFKVRKFI
jgi:hypothetical protein